MKLLLCHWVCSLLFVNALGCETIFHLEKTAEDRINLTGTINTFPVIREYVYLSELFEELQSYKICNVSIHLQPGLYYLAGSTNVTVNALISISSYEESEGVIISCVDRVNRGIHSKPQLWFNSTTMQGIVSINGLVFEACAYSLRFDNLDALEINNSTFRNFNSPALDISSVITIDITNSQLISNNVSSLNDQFRAGAGGISIAYNFQSPPKRQPHLSITGSSFINNTASIPSILLNDQIQAILQDNVYPARGGALGIVIIDSYVDVTTSISHCKFTGNYAGQFGGGIYMSIRGDNRNHSLSISNTKFLFNSCTTGGGALLVAYSLINRLNVPSVTEISNCEFYGNSANTSGALLVVQLQNIGTGNYITVKDTNFTSNRAKTGAAAVNLGAVFNVQSRQILLPSLFENCIFSDNNSTGGAMIASFVPVDFRGDNVFIHNQGPAIRASGSFMRVTSGNLSLINNNGEATSGGVALYVTALSQLQVFKDSHINFQDNIGSIGAAIRVDMPRLPLVFSEFITNPLCFLHYEDLILSPDKWPPGLIHFSGNRALLGSAIYASNIEACSYYSSTVAFNNPSQVFDISKFPDWPIFHFGVNVNTLHEGNTTNQRFYVQTHARRIAPDHSFNGDVDAFPGESSQLNMIGLDEFNNPTYFVGRIIDKDESLLESLANIFNVSESFQPPLNYSIVYRENDVPMAIYSPSLATFTPNKALPVTYALELPHTEELTSDSIVHINRTILIRIEENNRQVFEINFTLNVSACPPGFELHKVFGSDYNTVSCVCSGAEDNQFAVLDCEDDSDTIILRDGYWAGFDEGEGVPHLDLYTCPITYCQCISSSQSCTAQYDSTHGDRQCHPPRTGPLCGTCGNSTTVTILRLQCKENCQDSYTLAYAIVILILADILIIVSVLVLSVKFAIPFPHSLKGIVFYIQTVYIVTEYFPASFWNERQYMLYIGNLFGLYFPFDFCFVTGVSAVLTFLPRFIPIILLVVISAIASCFKKAKIRMWHGVWALIELLYTPLIYTCVSLLHCPALPDKNAEDDVNRWYLDGSVKCFHDVSHIMLGSIAIVFLLLAIAIIPAIAILVIWENHSFVQDDHPVLINIIKALKAGYDPQYKWWASVELLQRLLLTGLAVGLPGRSVATILVLFFFFVLYLYLRPIKYIFQNVLEVLVLLNYILLLLLRLTQSFLDAFNSYSGTMVPSQYGSDLPELSFMDLFFAVIFYLPIFALGIGVCVFWITVKIWKSVKYSSAHIKPPPDEDLGYFIINEEDTASLLNSIRSELTVTTSVVETS